MKTIQQYFQEVNVDELVNDYVFEYPITIRPCDNTSSTQTIAEVYEGYKSAVRGLIENIQSVEIVSDETDEMVFFVHHCTETEHGDDVCVMLAKLSDIKDEDKFTESYAYEFSSIAETAGYYVADTYLTQRNIGKVLLDYLSESSFFGFNQEDLDDARARLDEMVERANDVLENTENYMTFEEFSERIGLQPEVRDPDEKEAWRALIHAQADYNKFASEIEERKIREMIVEE